MKTSRVTYNVLYGQGPKVERQVYVSYPEGTKEEDILQMARKKVIEEHFNVSPTPIFNSFRIRKTFVYG